MNSLGYGVLRVDGRCTYAHRFALERALGRPIKKGMLALHTCDRSCCVNPKHLYEGTWRDNRNDALKRDRVPDKRAKVTPEAINDYLAAPTVKSGRKARGAVKAVREKHGVPGSTLAGAAKRVIGVREPQRRPGEAWKEWTR